MEMIKISKEEYNRLIERDRFLDALEQSGVDNWDGYSDAHTLIKQWDAEIEEDYE